MNAAIGTTSANRRMIHLRRRRTPMYMAGVARSSAEWYAKELPFPQPQLS